MRIITWGLWDSEDNIWFSDTDGPFLYKDGGPGCMDGATAHETAQLVASIASERMGWEYDPLYGRLRAREFSGHVTLKDTITPPLSMEDALDRMKARNDK
jgi:hypothetical protein